MFAKLITMIMDTAEVVVFATSATVTVLFMLIVTLRWPIVIGLLLWLVFQK